MNRTRKNNRKLRRSNKALQLETTMEIQYRCIGGLDGLLLRRVDILTKRIA
jgi:hypothetical protein